MAVYTVHAPSGFGTDANVTPDKLKFVRDGFHVWAFLLGIFWMLWNRLWLASLAYIVLLIALETSLYYFDLSNTGIDLLVTLIFGLLLGVEAGSIRRWKYSGRKWRQLDVVVAENEEAAERRFFDRWAGVVTGNGNSKKITPPLPRSSLPPDDVMGLFPQSGAQR